MMFLALGNKIKKIYTDKPVLYSLIGTCWRVLFAPISLYLVALKLSPEILGIYYIFFSIAGLQSIVEAGFSHTIIQSISHEMHSVKFENHRLIGNEDSIGRITQAMRLGFTWFLIVAASCIIFVLPIGYFIINSQSHVVEQSYWLLPWIIFILFFSTNLLLYPVNFFFEGILHLEKIYKNRLIIQIISSLLFIAALLMNMGIYVVAIASIVSLLINFIVLFLPNFAQFKEFLHFPKKQYFKSVFKWQAKISIVWCTGYLYWQLPSIFIFSILGPVISGQYGFTVNIINAITNIGQIFVRTKSAVIGKLRAEGNFIEAYAIFRSNSKYSYSIIILGFVSLCLLWILFPNIIIWKRMMPFIPSILLMFAFGINMITINQAMFARCSKEEPYFVMSLFINFGFPIAFYLFLLVFPNYWGIIYPFILMHIIELIWSTFIFKKLFNRWC